MTICLLVRHAAFDFGVRHLAGRSECALSLAGEDQARSLARILPRRAILQSSPRRRCLQTIAPHATAVGSRVSTAAALDEVDFGPWTARTFAALDHDPAWRHWNEQRAAARPPGGESMLEAQSRILRHIRDVAAGAPDGTVVMVTHAELIRAVALHCLSLSLDDWKSLDIPHASVTTVAVGRSEQMVLDQRIAA